MQSCFSCVQLCATPCTVAARLLCPWDPPGKNTGVGCLCPPPKDLLDPGVEPMSLVSPTLAGGLFTTGGSEVKASACNVGDLGSIPGSGRSPGEGHRQPTPVFLPGESHGRRSLVGYSPQSRRESDTTERLHFTSLLYN